MSCPANNFVVSLVKKYKDEAFIQYLHDWIKFWSMVILLIQRKLRSFIFKINIFDLVSDLKVWLKIFNCNRGSQFTLSKTVDHLVK